MNRFNDTIKALLVNRMLLPNFGLKHKKVKVTSRKYQKHHIDSKKHMIYSMKIKRRGDQTVKHRQNYHILDV